MDRGLEQLSVDFTTHAQQLFMSTYEMFRMTTKRLDRQRDENVFQMQVEKFMATLKQQLENIANDLLKKNKAIKDIDHCNKLLRDQITVYLKEFRQKARLL
jgi:hypothetical protein